MNKTLKDSLAEQMQNPAFRREWDDLEPEFQIINAIVDARRNQNLTQKQLAELTGIHQSDISKLESGNANPSLRTLQRLAAGMGMTMKVEFIPIEQTHA